MNLERGRLVIVGYAADGIEIFCVECWRQKAVAGHRPDRVLDSESADGRGDNFWIVDSCERCGRDVKYKEIVLLD